MIGCLSLAAITLPTCSNPLAGTLDHIDLKADVQTIIDNQGLLEEANRDATNMSDQLSFSRNQLFTETQDPPSPIIIKHELSNSVISNSLAYLIDMIPSHIEQGMHDASEMDKREAVDLCDATQITQDAIDLGELSENTEENDLPDGDMHGMSYDRRELNDSPAISACPELEDLKNTGKINKENNSCSSPEHRHLWSGIIPMSVLIVIVPANNRGVAEVVRLGDGLRKLPSTCQILESVSHCMHENIHSTGGSEKINMQTNCITHSSALSSQLFWAWSSRTDHSAFLTF